MSDNSFRIYLENNMFPRIEENYGRPLHDEEKAIYAAVFMEGASFFADAINEIGEMPEDQREWALQSIGNQLSTFISEMHLGASPVAGNA